MIIEKLKELPGAINYKNYYFELKIIVSNKECRLCYELTYGPNKDETGWWNRLLSGADCYCGFLYLVEGIQSDGDLIAAVENTKAWLKDKKLI